MDPTTSTSQQLESIPTFTFNSFSDSIDDLPTQSNSISDEAEVEPEGNEGGSGERDGSNGIVERTLNSSSSNLIQDRFESIEPVKNGEIGWIERNNGNRGGDEEGSEGNLTTNGSSNSNLSSARLQTLTGTKRRHPFKFLNQLHPATGKIFNLVSSLLIFLATLIVMFIILKSRLTMFGDNSDNNSNGNSTSINNSTSVNNNNFSNSTIYNSGTPYSSNSTTLTANSASAQFAAVSTSSITTIIILICLIVELVYIYSRVSLLYAFFRRRKLNLELKIGDNDIEEGVGGVELVDRNIPSTTSTLSTSRRREYKPKGFRKYLELLLNLPPKSLVPSLTPRLNNPNFESTLEEAELNRRERIRNLSEEDLVIERAHREGSAPFYGSDEMRGSKMILNSRNNSIRRSPSQATSEEVARNIPLPLSRNVSIASTIRRS